MSQPPPLPPHPTTPPLLPAAAAGLAMGVQIVLGIVLVGAGLVGLLVLSMMLLTALRIDSVYVMIGIMCVGSLVVGVPIAWWLQGNPAHRGWAIGIYIGLGLHLLVQAGFTFLVVVMAMHQR